MLGRTFKWKSILAWCGVAVAAFMLAIGGYETWRVAEAQAKSTQVFARLIYYGKPLQEIDEDQFLSLVAVLASPNEFNPRLHPEANSERVIRLKRLIAGTCTEKNISDSRLSSCAQGS